MAQPILIEVEVPETLARLHLPAGVQDRLQSLLDRQDQEGELNPEEQREAEGLVDLAELLSLLRLRARRIEREASG
jgi:hypothetical protein